MNSKKVFETTDLPQRCASHILKKKAHNELGPNGSTRICMILKRLYYWKGLKPVAHIYTRQFGTCQQMK